MFKKSLINFRTKSALRKNKAIRKNMSFSESKKIGLIHHYVDNQSIQSIYHFFDSLEKQGKKVDVMVIKDKKDELNIPEFLMTDSQEMTAFGQWTNESLLNYINQSFDYLIHLNLDDSIFIENILANSKAKCRVGKFQEEKKEYYELMISPEKDTIQKLIDQIYHYIQKI